MKTLCLDFDGVLHSYTSGWQGAGKIPDPPAEGAMEFLCNAIDQFDVAIYSSRSSSLRGRWAMKRWLRQHMIEHCMSSLGSSAFDAYGEAVEDAEFFLEKIRWPWFKPAAHVTLDDRAMQFTGEWPAISDLMRFRPWNK
jgi:hypothetical protein